jgi:hypothetical protein
MKSKSTAIVLAVFFSFWSWLYTYRKNLVKFWIILSLNIIAAIVIFINGSIFIGITKERLTESVEYLRGFETLFNSNSANIPEASYRTFGIIILILIFIGIYKIVVWMWAIIYNAIKPKAFYTFYSNGK